MWSLVKMPFKPFSAANFTDLHEVSLSKRQTFVLSLAPPARAGVVSFVVS
jgi:hypothetical protein